MTMKPGEEDKPHTHPVHHMYVLSGGDLMIQTPPGSEAKAASLPTGAPVPGFPAGPHQVKNVGNTNVEVIFVEPSGTYGETPAEHKTPFETNPEMYENLGSNDNWIIGMMEMKAGAEDQPHSHHDHFVYVLEGSEITIYPGKTKDESTKLVVPIQPGAAIPVPSGWHIVKNTGSDNAKMVFFELSHS